MSSLEQVKRLIEYRGTHRVISLYLDLDPERFATPPARASQVRSLLDEAAREVDRMGELAHEEKVGLREDLKRIDALLSSPEAPFKGARSLAIFASGRDGLFETIQLTRAVAARVVIEPVPYVEPMLAAVQWRRWLVALVNRRSAWLLAGSPERFTERERVDDDVRGQHEQGGWSQARYERSVDKDVMDHLRSVAETVNRRWRQERFHRIVVGGPQEVVVRFEELLSDEVRDRLAPRKVDVDLSSATEAQVQSEVEQIVVEDERRDERETLDRYQNALGSGARATGGLPDTLQALNERRVQTLLLAPGFDREGGRCSSDGMLVVDPDGRCPGDGAPIERVEHMREAVVQVAVYQDADVLVVTHYPEREPRDGIGALLRF